MTTDIKVTKTTPVLADGKDDEKKKGVQLLIYDMKQKKLIPIKLLFFVVISSKFCFILYILPFHRSMHSALATHCGCYVIGIGVLLPFMTIHMKSLGISVSETAVIYGVFPPFAILAPSTMGMVADKLGNFKV